MASAGTDGTPAPVDVHQLGVQHRADWVRAQVLKDRGGVWLDAACIVYRPIDEWMQLAAGTLIAGYIYPHCKGANVLENWALFVPKGSAFMAAWCDEFDGAVRMGLDQYVKAVEAQGRLPPPGLQLPYHAMHVAGWNQPCIPSSRPDRWLPTS